MSARDIVGYVFGYGSLIDPGDWLAQRNQDRYPEPGYVLLEGYRRHWDLAARNAGPEHDHKYYADAGSGERPDIEVASLGLELADGFQCNGLAIPVDRQRLEWLDTRESLLYDRIVVEPVRISSPLDLVLWAYFPKPSALAVFGEGLRQRRVFVAREYADRVVAAFAGRGTEALAAYQASTRAPRCPVRDLKLVRAPGDAGI